MFFPSFSSLRCFFSASATSAYTRARHQRPKHLLAGVLCSFVLAHTPSAYAQGNKALQAAVRLASKDLTGCTIQKNHTIAVYAPSGEHLFLVLPYEGCNGGNNWGQQVLLLSHFNGSTWKNVENLSFSGVQSVQVQGQQFIINTLTHGPQDARCCPTVESVHKMPIPNS